MDDLAKEFVIDFFNRNLMLHGDRPEALRWTRQGQLLRFEAMLDIGDINGSKVLDFGCGKGDFSGFLKDRGIDAEYTGCDINANLISLAQRKYPDEEFLVLDIMEEDLPGEYDFIFLCGVFNLQVQGVDETIRESLRRLIRRCRKGLAFNGLSDLNPRREFELHYTSPGDILSFAVKELSPYVALRHDRVGYDFTLFVYREPNPFRYNRR
ncbi:MAG: class I SAM-dependent methyltransferase [Thermodesulfovibrionales bacterium]|jgi:SAM-dependent methyltransferase